MILVYNSQLDNLKKKYKIVKSNSAYLEQHYEEQNRLNNERVSNIFKIYYGKILKYIYIYIYINIKK